MSTDNAHLAALTAPNDSFCCDNIFRNLQTLNTGGFNLSMFSSKQKVFHFDMYVLYTFLVAGCHESIRKSAVLLSQPSS